MYMVVIEGARLSPESWLTNQPISKTPIMEKVALSCMNSIVIGTNENYNGNTVPENRHFKFGLKLPYVDSPVIPAEGIEYDLDTNMVTYVPYDYKSVHFPLAPSQTFTFLKKNDRIYVHV